jgi:hypothetical protein
MGLNNNEPGGESPRTALFATGTPDELTAMGINLVEKPSCCVPVKGGISGCPHAINCSKLFGQDRFGGFGPRSTEPGTAGSGPEYVAYYVETPEGDAKEDFIRCSAFMAGLYGRMRAMDDPTEPSGEVIHILGSGRDGKTKIRTVETLPEAVVNGEPRGSKNMKMVDEEKVFIVPKHLRPAQVDKSGNVRQSAAMRRAAAAQRFGNVLSKSVAEETPVTHAFGEEGGPVSVVSEPSPPPKEIKRRGD